MFYYIAPIWQVFNKMLNIVKNPEQICFTTNIPQVEPSLTLSNDLKRACELLERSVINQYTLNYKYKLD